MTFPPLFVCKVANVFKIFLTDIFKCRILGPLIPLFCISGDASLLWEPFKARVRHPVGIAETHGM